MIVSIDIRGPNGFAVQVRPDAGILMGGDVTLNRKAKPAGEAQLELADPRGAFANGWPLPRKGALTCDISLGARTSAQRIFAGQIVGFRHHGPPGRLSLRVRDKSRGLRKHERTRTLADTTPLALAGRLAAEQGLTLDATRADLGSYTLAEIIQHGETDFALLARVMDQMGHDVTVAGDRLVVSAVGESVGEPVILRYGRDVTSYGFDINETTPLDTATLAARQGELMGRDEEDGVEDEEARGQITELYLTGHTIDHGRVPSWTRQDDEARARSKARGKRRRKASVSVKRVLPEISHESVVLLDGFGARFDRAWTVERVTHGLTTPHTSLELTAS